MNHVDAEHGIRPLNRPWLCARIQIQGRPHIFQFRRPRVDARPAFSRFVAGLPLKPWQ
jgi:hypothetical protein